MSHTARSPFRRPFALLSLTAIAALALSTACGRLGPPRRAELPPEPAELAAAPVAIDEGAPEVWSAAETPEAQDEARRASEPAGTNAW